MKVACFDTSIIIVVIALVKYVSVCIMAANISLVESTNPLNAPRIAVPISLPSWLQASLTPPLLGFMAATVVIIV